MLKKWCISVFVGLFLVACDQPDSYVGTWRAEINGQEVITDIQADGTVEHRRGEKDFYSTWSVDDEGNLVMDEGHVVGKLEKGKLIVMENNKQAVLERVEKP